MRQLISVLAFAALVACGDSSSGGPSATTITGTYPLRTFNGNAVPYVVNITGDRLEVLSGSLVLTDAGGYTTALSIRFLQPTGVTVTQNTTDSGVFVVAGANVTLKSSKVGVRDAVGTIAGKTASFFDGKDTFVFQKP